MGNASVVKTAVVTGSTRGIGFGLAKEFLRRGHNVVISGRRASACTEAAGALAPFAAADARVLAVPCDVSDYAQVQHLWDEAVAAFKRVDIWINNAGMANTRLPIGALLRDEVSAVVRTNVLGTMYGAKIALAGMRAQGSGAIYNFEGFGSNGQKSPGISLYGCTKFGITYFTKALIAETKGGPVRVGYLSPGIVMTDMILDDRPKMTPEAWAKVMKVYNILGDRVETVTPWLVEQVLADTRHGARLAWLTIPGAIGRFVKARISRPQNRFPEYMSA